MCRLHRIPVIPAESVRKNDDRTNHNKTVAKPVFNQVNSEGKPRFLYEKRRIILQERFSSTLMRKQTTCTHAMQGTSVTKANVYRLHTLLPSTKSATQLANIEIRPMTILNGELIFVAATFVRNQHLPSQQPGCRRLNEATPRSVCHT